MSAPSDEDELIQQIVTTDGSGSVTRSSFETTTTDDEDEDDAAADEDAEVRLAKQMAMAIAQNPGLTAEQIREMTANATAAAAASKKKSKAPRLKQATKTIRQSVKQGGKQVKDMFKMTGGSGSSHGKKSALERTYSGRSAGGSTGGGSERGGVDSLEAVSRGSPGRSPRAATRKSAPAASAPPMPGLPKTVAPRLGDYLGGAESSSHDEPPPADGNTGYAQRMAAGGGHRVNDNQIRITGIVWKRRSGLGKYSVSQAWERRRIVLKGNKLFYYRTIVDSKDDESVDSKDDNSQIGDDRPVLGWLESSLKTATAYSNSLVAQTGVTTSTVSSGDGGKGSARGTLNLVKENASVCASYGHSGSPTPFALSIKVLTQTKWKLCFDTHAELMEWLAATTDVIVQGSVDDYNSQILQANDPKYAGDYATGQLSEPPMLAQCGTTMAGGHRLWVTGQYQVHSEHYAHELDDISEGELEDVESDDDLTVNQDSPKKRVLTRQASMDAPYFALDPESGTDVWSFPAEYIVQFALLWNVAIIVARASSTSVENFWYLLTFANMVLFGCLTKEKVGGTVKHNMPNMTPKMARRFSMNSSFPVMSTTDSIIAGDGNHRNMSMGMVSTASADPPPAESADFTPHAGSTTIRINNPTDLPVKDGHVYAGWRRADPSEMQIRSHGYKKTKAKVASPGDLYECVRSDIFEARTRYPDMASRVKLPKTNFKDDGPKTWNAPDVFVVSIAIPTDPPKLYGSTENGGGYTVTMYFVMRQDTRDILKRVTADGYDPNSEKFDDVQKSKVNAARLFDEWCRRAPTDDSFMARFKVLPNAQNLKEIGLPTWISKYNGKPFLIKRPGETGFLYRHPDKSCMEFDISLHPFPYLAKQGICYMKDSYFKKVLVTFGFLIEGRADDELPECLIGLMQLCYPDPSHAIQGEDLFAGKSPSSIVEEKKK